MGLIYLKKKEYWKAAELFIKATQLKPNDALYKINLGKSYLNYIE